MESVSKQVQHNTQQKFKTGEERAAEEARKAKIEKEKMEKELASLFKQSIKQPKLEAGVDPKSVICEFFKQGVCEKGNKCKFSHDLTMARKSAKLNVYSDRRQEDEEGKKDEMADWDQAKLESVVKTKHGAESSQPKTEIVCKYFLDAIEKELYGWFWVCPNGGDQCKYRHALPPGFVFKTKKERELEAAMKAEGEAEDIDIGEIIEAERARLPPNGTKVTAESFKAWKAARDARKADAIKQKQEEEIKKGQATGKQFKVLSGRALFTYDPSLFVDDADASNDVYDGAEAPEDENNEDDGDNNNSSSSSAPSQRHYNIDENNEDGDNTEYHGTNSNAGVYDKSVFLEGEDDDDLDDIDDDDEEEE